MNNNEIKVDFDELTEEEIEQCIESYYCLVEHEVEMPREQIKEEHPDLFPDKNEVENLLRFCNLYKDLNTGYISVLL